MRSIDADALKETARANFGDDITSITLFKVFEELIDNAPTIEERPQGKWIATQAIGIPEITLTCSNCKDEFIGENDIETWNSVYHYCPSCGAYMGF